jgi:hypothetical protein
LGNPKQELTKEVADKGARFTRQKRIDKSLIGGRYRRVNNWLESCEIKEEIPQEKKN